MMTVDATGTFNIGGTLVGGTLTTQTGAVISGGLFNGVTVSGDFLLTGNSAISIVNGLTLNGTATLGSSVYGGYLSFNGTQTLGGTGMVVFGNSHNYNALLETTAGAALTIGSGITVRGQTGYLGYDS